MTERLARACAAHPWRTVAAWLVGIVLGVVGAGAGLGDLTTEGEVTNNPDSIRAERLIDQRLPGRPAASELVVVRSDRVTAKPPKHAAPALDVVTVDRLDGPRPMLLAPGGPSGPGRGRRPARGSISPCGRTRARLG